LLTDIRGRKVDIVVVYKVDRARRSPLFNFPRRPRPRARVAPAVSGFLQLQPKKIGIEMIDETTAEPRKNAKSMRGRPFQTGNPGRRPGARGKAAVIAEKLAAKDITDIVNVLVEAAKGGDVQSAALLLARLWPAPKGRLVAFELPAINTAADGEAAIGAVLSAVASAKISAEEADKIVSIIKSKVETQHMRITEERLERLEAAQPQQISSYRRVS
jgi:hypothetical protein